MKKTCIKRMLLRVLAAAVIVVAMSISMASGIGVMGCFGSSAAPAPPVEIPLPISLNVIDGGKGIPVDGTFKYIFPQAVDKPTVSTGSFYMVKTADALAASLSSPGKAPFDPDICQPNLAIAATVDCPVDTECVLTPDVQLDFLTQYTACLDPSINFADASPNISANKVDEGASGFDGASITFTTEWEFVVASSQTVFWFDGVAIDGAVDVSVYTGIRMRFLYAVDTSTLQAYIVATPNACVAANAIPATILWTGATGQPQFIAYLDPEGDLQAGIKFEVCWSGAYESGDIFSGSSTFITEASPPPPPPPEKVAIVAVQLINLDDSVRQLSERAISEHALVRVDLVPAVPDADRAAVQAALSLVDALAIPVGFAFNWIDSTTLEMIPDQALGLDASYRIVVDENLLPAFNLSKALDYSTLTFTTRTRGDTDGDGFADLVVGEGGNGAVYIVLGSASISDFDMSAAEWPEIIIIAEHSGDMMRGSVSMAGDLNGDGYEDVLIGAESYSDPGMSLIASGAAYVFYGPIQTGTCDMSAGCTADVTIINQFSNALFGKVAPAGDVNGDGYDDVVIGSQGYKRVASPNVGRVYLYLGSSTGIDTTEDATITGESLDDRLGSDVSTAGDVNGDGYDDIIIGAHNYSAGAGPGAAYILQGSASGISSCTIGGGGCESTTIIGKNMGDQLGTSVSTAGDINGDGFADVIVGAPKNSGDTGEAYILHGSGGAIGIADCDLSGACVPNTTIGGAHFSDELGDPASLIGDINGDGLDDIAVGSNGYDSVIGTEAGAVYIFFGSGSGIANCVGPGCTPDIWITGENGSDELAQFPRVPLDLDGDGADDVVVGALRYPSSGAAGAAYIFYGPSSNIPATCDMSTIGGCVADVFGRGKDSTYSFGILQ